MELYEVGGCVRDEIMGVNSKDIDFSVVLTEFDLNHPEEKGKPPFEIMASRLRRMGYTIFIEKPEYLTIRAKFPPMGTYGLVGRDVTGLTADFVLARKEADYSDGRRPDAVVPGTLRDDLERRDFTMNAMAKDSNGVLHDPFNGRADIDDKIIRAVGSPVKRLNEDALRGLRALRFSITKGFTIEKSLSAVIACKAFRDRLSTVSVERQREELEKMFAVNSLRAVRLLDAHNLMDVLFTNTGLRLMPTMKG